MKLCMYGGWEGGVYFNHSLWIWAAFVINGMFRCDVVLVSDLTLKSPGASASVFSREASFHAIKELTRLLNNEAQSRERDRERGGKGKRQEEKKRPHRGWPTWASISLSSSSRCRSSWTQPNVCPKWCHLNKRTLPGKPHLNSCLKNNTLLLFLSCSFSGYLICISRKLKDKSRPHDVLFQPFSCYHFNSHGRPQFSINLNMYPLHTIFWRRAITNICSLSSAGLQSSSTVLPYGPGSFCYSSQWPLPIFTVLP